MKSSRAHLEEHCGRRRECFEGDLHGRQLGGGGGGDVRQSARPTAASSKSRAWQFDSTWCTDCNETWESDAATQRRHQQAHMAGNGWCSLCGKTVDRTQARSRHDNSTEHRIHLQRLIAEGDSVQRVQSKSSRAVAASDSMSVSDLRKRKSAEEMGFLASRRSALAVDVNSKEPRSLLDDDDNEVLAEPAAGGFSPDHGGGDDDDSAGSAGSDGESDDDEPPSRRAAAAVVVDDELTQRTLFLRDGFPFNSADVVDFDVSAQHMRANEPLGFDEPFQRDMVELLVAGNNSVEFKRDVFRVLRVHGKGTDVTWDAALARSRGDGIDCDDLAVKRLDSPGAFAFASATDAVVQIRGRRLDAVLAFMIERCARERSLSVDDPNALEQLDIAAGRRRFELLRTACEGPGMTERDLDLLLNEQPPTDYCDSALMYQLAAPFTAALAAGATFLPLSFSFDEAGVGVARQQDQCAFRVRLLTDPSLRFETLFTIDAQVVDLHDAILQHVVPHLRALQSGLRMTFGDGTELLVVGATNDVVLDKLGAWQLLGTTRNSAVQAFGSRDAVWDALPLVGATVGWRNLRALRTRLVAAQSEFNDQAGRQTAVRADMRRLQSSVLLSARVVGDDGSTLLPRTMTLPVWCDDVFWPLHDAGSLRLPLCFLHQHHNGLANHLGVRIMRSLDRAQVEAICSYVVSLPRVATVEHCAKPPFRNVVSKRGDAFYNVIWRTMSARQRLHCAMQLLPVLSCSRDRRVAGFAAPLRAYLAYVRCMTNGVLSDAAARWIGFLGALKSVRWALPASYDGADDDGSFWRLPKAADEAYQPLLHWAMGGGLAIASTDKNEAKHQSLIRDFSGSTAERGNRSALNAETTRAVVGGASLAASLAGSRLRQPAADMPLTFVAAGSTRCDRIDVDLQTLAVALGTRDALRDGAVGRCTVRQLLRGRLRVLLRHSHRDVDEAFVVEPSSLRAPTFLLFPGSSLQSDTTIYELVDVFEAEIGVERLSRRGRRVLSRLWLQLRPYDVDGVVDSGTVDIEMVPREQLTYAFAANEEDEEDVVLDGVQAPALQYAAQQFVLLHLGRPLWCVALSEQMKH